MKIVNREEFLKMHDKLLYQKFTPLYFHDSLCLKVENLDNDWTYIQLNGEIDSDSDSDYIDKLNEYQLGKEFKFSMDTICRDGCFDESQLFAIYDKDDIIQLVKKLINII